MGAGSQGRSHAGPSRNDQNGRFGRVAGWLAIGIAVAFVAAATLGSPPDPFEGIEEASVADIEGMLRRLHTLQVSFHAEHGRYAASPFEAGLSPGDLHPGVDLDVVYAEADDYCAEAVAILGGYPYLVSPRHPTPVRAGCWRPPA